MLPLADPSGITDHVIPGSLSSRFRRSLVILALDKDQPRADRAKALGGAFMWAESPQGAAFWQYQQDQIAFGDLDGWRDGDWFLTDQPAPRPCDLTPEAEEQLRAWLVQCMAV